MKERTAFIDLCRRLTKEQDPVEFQRLVLELLELLERVAPEMKNDSKPN
jgi:hypothetical protein